MGPSSKRKEKGGETEQSRKWPVARDHRREKTVVRGICGTGRLEQAGATPHHGPSRTILALYLDLSPPYKMMRSFTHMLYSTAKQSIRQQENM
eukprot:gene4967-3565_t